MNRKPDCPHCGRPRGTHPTSCDGCHAFLEGAAAVRAQEVGRRREGRYALVLVVLLLAFLSGSLASRLLLPKAPVETYEKAFWAMPTGGDGPRPWGEILPNPYGADWEPDPFRSCLWSLGGDVLSAHGKTTILWHRRPLAGKVHMEFEARVREQGRYGPIVIAHASRALARDLGRWPHDNGFWFGNRQRERAQEESCPVLGRMDGDWRLFPRQILKPHLWHHIRCRLEGTELRLFVDGTLVASWSHPFPIDAAGFDNLGIVLDNTDIRKVKVHEVLGGADARE